MGFMRGRIFSVSFVLLAALLTTGFSMCEPPGGSSSVTSDASDGDGTISDAESDAVVDPCTLAQQGTGPRSGCFQVLLSYTFDECAGSISTGSPVFGSTTVYILTDLETALQVREPTGNVYSLPQAQLGGSTYQANLRDLVGQGFSGTHGIRFVGNDRFNGWLSQSQPCLRDATLTGTRVTVSPAN